MSAVMSLGGMSGAGRGGSLRHVSFRAPVMPWAGAGEDEARFKRISQRVLGVTLLLAVLMPWIPVHLPERVVQPVPAHLAKLVIDQHEQLKPPPPPVVARAQEALPQHEKAEPKKPDAAKPDKAKAQPAKGAVAPEARNPVPNKPPGEVLDGIRRKAAGVGLLAMKDQLAELRGAPVAVQLQNDIKPGRGVGTGVGPGVGAGKDPGIPVRNMITSNAAGGSGGINTAAYSRDTGGGGLAGRATTLVEGVAGGGGGGGEGGGGVRGGHGHGAGTGAGGGGGTLTKGGGGKASRSIEEVRLVFERNKGAIYAIYNRALREDPTLQGKVVLKLKIAPSGQVLECNVVSSELKTPELESKLLARIRQFDFGAKDVNEMVVTYPVDFLPS